MAQLKRCLLLVCVLALAVGCGAPATPPPTATLTPPAAASPTSTATLAPTATATLTPVPSDTPTAVPTADPLHTACDHPYWPLREGAVWEHQLEAGNRIQTITAVNGDLENAEATLEQVDPDGTQQVVQLLCSAEGIAYGDATVTRPDGQVGTKRVTAHEGVSLVSAEQLLAGAAWSWTQTADYDFPAYTDGVYTGQSVYTNVSGQDCRALGLVTVTVPFGTFDALHVECTGENVSTTAAGASSTFPLNSTAYYVLGLGSLSLADSAPVLISYDIPGDAEPPEPPADPLHTVCDHAYLPLRQGARWEYTDGNANWIQEVTEVTGDLTRASATLVTRYASGDTVAFTYHCTESGLLMAASKTDIGEVHSTLANTGLGVHLVRADQLVPGAAWHYQGEQDYANLNGQTLHNSVAYDYVAEPLVTLETVAGPFEALPVTITFTSTANASGPPITTTNWYASGVGLIYADVGGQTKWDLVSFEIP